MKLVIIKFPHDVPQFFEDVCTMAENLAYDITAVVSLEKNPATTSIKGYPVVPLTKIYDLQWDVAILVDGGNFFDDFVDKMVAWKIGTREQFKNSFWLLKQFMIKKYEDCADPVIQETMKFWQTNDFSVFNQHLDFNVGISNATCRIFTSKPVAAIGAKCIILKTKNFILIKAKKFFQIS